MPQLYKLLFVAIRMKQPRLLRKWQLIQQFNDYCTTDVFEFSKFIFFEVISLVEFETNLIDGYLRIVEFELFDDFEPGFIEH